MGEIHVNDIDMGPVEWIEVKQLLNGASYVSIAWVSKVGDLGYGWSLQELINTLRVRGDKKAECTIPGSHLWNNTEQKKNQRPVSFAWIASYSFRMARVRIKQNLLTFLLTSQCFFRLSFNF